ncbi:MAG: hypothetical protein K9W42_12895 [Candidatus Heimdallarchaeota archaeon]|nr:hypothetical protein [Candidatus Heimdallarchaeota archaeon]
MKMEVKVEHIDDELLFKRVNIRLGNNNLITPIKASFKGHKVSPVNEIYKEFKLDKLDQCLMDERVERSENQRIRRLLTDSAINTLIISYPNLEIPDEKHIEVLSDIQYENSDLIVTPIWTQMIRKLPAEELVQTFIQLTNTYIEIVETLNRKTIIGIVPSRIPRQFLEPVLKNYYNNNITSFIIDFDGRSIDTNPSWIRKLLRLMKDYEIMDESFLYAINANKGKFMKNALEILAKDFISLGFGVDVLGLNHIPPRLSSEAWKKIKQKRRENTLRLFNRKSYGYEKKTEDELRQLNLPIKREEIKKYNISEQQAEAIVLQEVLREESTIKPYIATKEQVNEKVIKKIENIRAKTISKA